MALGFTDEQIKNITKDIVLLPFVIDDPINGTGFVQQKENLFTVKEGLGKTDDDQQVFSNFWRANISLYHQEYDLLAKSLGTLYSDSDLQEGGKERGAHWPFTPAVWIPLIPKMLPSNNSEPFTPTTTIIETNRIAGVTLNIQTMVNGFSYGSFNGSVENHVAGYFELNSSSDIDVNDLGVLSSGASNTTVIRILTKVPYVPAVPPVPGPSEPEITAEFTYEILGGYTGSHGATPNFTLSASPISNAKRGRQVSLTPQDIALLDIYETNLTQSVEDWKLHMDAQKAIIDQYDDSPPRKQANLDAGQAILDSKDVISGWEGLGVVDPDGKWTDTGLAILEAEITARTAKSNARKTELKDVQLGTIVQDGGTGEVTGNGIHLEQWATTNLRIGKGTGTLNSFNSIDLGVVLFEKKITDANKQLEQYENIFAVAKIISDTETGDIEFEVDDVAQFAPLQSVKVMDNSSIIYDRTINSITGNVIRLDSGIPAVLAVGALGRIIRQK